MLDNDKIWMGVSDEGHVNLLLNQANRHGLIAGASGTGKTVTLKVMAEGFSKAGVPVFMADVKGDVTGMCQPGEDSDNIKKRVEKFQIPNWTLEGCPCRMWDMLGGQGIPVRITISDMGPTMISRLLGLSEAQEGVMEIVFRVADDQQMELIDMKDLRAMLNWVGDNAKDLATTYGQVSTQSVGSILRELISVEDEGGNTFFGEPNIDLQDWFACDANGHGYVNILNAEKLINSPQIYAMFLLWMLSDLFETLPEAGDLDKPKFVFFFDEAHLLFNDMPKELLDKVIQVVKLIRSKAVGVYFITQSPSDIPDEVLAQLSNRVQHGLRAYTPAEQKAVKAAAQAFRENPNFKAEDVIMNLGTGEALVSFLDENGTPCVVQNTKILCPQCLMAAADQDHINAVLNGEQDLMNKYGTAVDPESAYEKLQAQKQAADQAQQQADQQAAEQAQQQQTLTAQALADAQAQKEAEKAAKEAEKEAEREAKEQAKLEAQKQKEHDKAVQQVTKTVGSVLGQIGREASRQIVRGLFGNKIKL